MHRIARDCFIEKRGKDRFFIAESRAYCKYSGSRNEERALKIFTSLQYNYRFLLFVSWVKSFLVKSRLLFLLTICGWFACMHSLQGQTQKHNSVTASLRQQLNIPDNFALSRMAVPERIHQYNSVRYTILNGPFNQRELKNLVSELKYFAKEQSDADFIFHIGIIVCLIDVQISLTDTDKIHHFEILQNLARKLDKGWMLAEAKYQFSNFLIINLKRHENGLMLIREAVGLMEAGDEKQFPNKQLITAGLASTYLSFGDLSSACFFGKKALLIKMIPPLVNARLTLLNLLGFAYREKNMLDSSDYFYRQEVREALQKTDSVCWALAMGNLGENQYLRKNYAAALPLLKIDYEKAIANKDWGLASNAILLMADIHLKNKKLEQCGDFLSIGKNLVNKSNWPFYRKKKLFPVLSSYYSAKGFPDLVQMYFDSSLYVIDSLQRLKAACNAARMEPLFANLQQKKKMLEQEEKNLADARRRNWIIFTLLFGLLAVLVLYFQHRIRAKFRQQQLLAKNNDLMLDLEKARTELNDFVHEIIEKDKAFQQMEADVKRLKSQIELQVDESSNPEFEGTDQLRNAVFLTSTDWIRFKQLFIKLHPSFFEQLKEKNPKLTPAEIRFAALCKLELNTKDMAAMLKVTEVSIRQTRKRLRLKFGLEPGGNLDLFIREI